MSSGQFMQSSGGLPVWIAEDTGLIVDVYDPKTYIYNTAIGHNLFQYISDGSSVYIEPNTYYYYTGRDSISYINSSFFEFLNVPLDTSTPPQANRIYQMYPIARYLMLTNTYITGTLNPTTTKPLPIEIPYPEITIVNNALETNNDNLFDQRFNILDTQDTLTALTNKLNNLKLKLSSLKQQPLYSASGHLKFY